ncbi:hypothetical protein NFI96_034411, partial [Prochilodus magdalenae]
MTNLLHGTTPPRGRLFSLSAPEEVTVEGYIREALANGFIQPSTYPAVLQQATIFTKLDLHSAYNLIRQGDEWKTAFMIPSGHYEYWVDTSGAELRHWGSLPLSWPWRSGGTGWRGLNTCLWFGRITRTWPTSNRPSGGIVCFSRHLAAGPEVGTCSPIRRSLWDEVDPKVPMEMLLVARNGKGGPSLCGVLSGFCPQQGPTYQTSQAPSPHSLSSLVPCLPGLCHRSASIP